MATEHLREITDDTFLEDLQYNGCKVVIYVEFVPVSEESSSLAPGDSERGCLTAGRVFFHINSHGRTEPCPFSPYSDINVKDTSLREALRSSLFMSLHDQSILTGEHSGGCVFLKNERR